MTCTFSLHSKYLRFFNTSFILFLFSNHMAKNTHNITQTIVNGQSKKIKMFLHWARKEAWISITNGPYKLETALDQSPSLLRIQTAYKTLTHSAVIPLIVRVLEVESEQLSKTGNNVEERYLNNRFIIISFMYS